ncbi:uncharacterized protein LOC124270312 isoform X2 [Haliotis rubra]|nr:uncharacterized protein LOC124270312 isoform X2 [Haliotis rubra]XP_046561314.1 uncharacterized protein LOC124270312 isoform X2 [Haliotis rubra]
MSETVFYQPGMSLGRTFDLRTYGNGLDIFPEDLVDNPKIIESHYNTVKYRVIKNSQDINNILELSGEVALKIKAGILNVEGMASYVKEDKIKDECTEIFVRVHVETLTETLRDLTPRRAWGEHLIGSHFIRSITYGGDLLVRIRIRGSDRAKIEDVEAKLKGNIGPFKLPEAKLTLDKRHKDIRDDIETEIEYLSTSVDCEMPRDVEELMRVLNSFKWEVLKINNGKGVPCKCELLPLSVLDSTIPTQTKDKSLDMLLVQVDEKFDDLRFAKKHLERFVENPSLEMTETLSKEYEELEGRIDDVLDEFHHVISRLDMTLSGDGPSQFTHILSVYKEKKKIGGFQKEVTLFIKRHKPEESTVCPQLTDEYPKTDMGASSEGCTGSLTEQETGLSVLVLEKGGSSESCVLGQVLFSDPSLEPITGAPVSRTARENTTLVRASSIFTQSSEGQCLSDIGTSIAYAPLGFHAVLFVIYIDQNMNRHDRNTLKLLRSVLGSDMIKTYGAVALVHDDVFETGSEASLSNSIETAKAQDDTLAHLLDECGNRCVFINRKDLISPSELQAAQSDLLQVIDKVQVKTRHTTLSNDYFVLSKRLMAEVEEDDNLAFALNDSLGNAQELVQPSQDREGRVGAKLAELFEI